MNKNTLKSECLLLVTAIIWGFSFVSQRLGLDHIEPFFFNAVRFLLGGLVLIPIAWYFGKKQITAQASENVQNQSGSTPSLLVSGLLLGCFLFLGASFQQVGLLYTTAGNAGFITGLYIIFVPVIGILWGQKTQSNTWVGGLLAVFGLYLLCVKEGLSFSKGDLLQLVGACFWACHVLLIGWASPKHNPIVLSVIQFFVCAALSLLVAITTEDISLQGLKAGWASVAYNGLISVGVAYTLQVIGQQNVPASHSAIILSLEAVFAVVGGYIFLAEVYSIKSLIGCGFMLAGMLISQVRWPRLTGRAFGKPAEIEN